MTFEASVKVNNTVSKLQHLNVFFQQYLAANMNKLPFTGEAAGTITLHGAYKAFYTQGLTAMALVRSCSSCPGWQRNEALWSGHGLLRQRSHLLVPGKLCPNPYNTHHSCDSMGHRLIKAIPKRRQKPV